MPFSRPTLPRLIARAKSDIESRLVGADATLRHSVEFVLGETIAGTAHGLHGHLAWLSRQLFPDTAEDEFMIRLAGIWDLSPTRAVKAKGQITITGTNGATCDAGTLWQTGDGVVYEQDAVVVVASGSATANVTAQLAGATGNLAVGGRVSPVSPVSGIDTDAPVTSSGST